MLTYIELLTGKNDLEFYGFEGCAKPADYPISRIHRVSLDGERLIFALQEISEQCADVLQVIATLRNNMAGKVSLCSRLGS